MYNLAATRLIISKRVLLRSEDAEVVDKIVNVDQGLRDSDYRRGALGIEDDVETGGVHRGQDL